MSYPPPPGPENPYGQQPPGQPPYGQPPSGQPPYGQPPGYPAYPPNQPQPVAQTSGKATTSLVLGIVSLVFCGLLTGIPALIVGFSARREIRASNGRLSGDGLAIAGMITAVLGILWSVALAALIVVGGIFATEVSSELENFCEDAAASSEDPEFTAEDC